jgi:DNA-binding LacI/PurR family transcriptional regulator
MESPLGSSTRRPTIEDVALAAGVSVATVSRALRGLPNVAVSTRSRVRDTAAAMRYRPNPAASRLAAGRSRTVTVVVPTLNSWYFSTVVAGAEAVCAESDYDFLVVGLGSADERARFFAPLNQVEHRTDGLILVEVRPDGAQAASLRSRGIAISTVGARVEGFPSVRVDDVEVGRIAIEHLLDLGHDRVGVIGGMPEDPMNFDVPKLRRQGVLDALAERGLALSDDLVAAGNFSIDGGAEAMSLLLDCGRPPTAVFAFSDEMAFGALMTAAARGVRVGRDISLIGVDDHEFSRVVDLTTVRQRVAWNGAAAARALISMMSEQRIDTFDQIAPIELVVRSTTGHLRSEGTATAP